MSSDYSNALKDHRHLLNRYQISNRDVDVRYMTSELYAITALLLIREIGLEQILVNKVKEAKLNLNYQLKDK